MKIFLVATLLALTSFSGFAQDESTVAPKYSNEFLQIGVGARSLAMSNSVIASVDDATAGYWNPAGLLEMNDNLQIGLMHAEYFAGIAKYDYASIAKKIDSSSAFGVSFIRFGVDNIPNTTELIDAQGNIDYDRITTFSAADYAFIFSYARKIKGLDLGANAKIIHRKVGTFGKSWGFGLDLGAKYKVKTWSFGATFRDITTTFNAWSYSLSDETIDVFTLTGNDIPENSVELTLPRLLLGAGKDFKIKEKFNILAEVGFDATFDGKRNTLIQSDFMSLDPHMGLEISYNKMIYMRAGMGNYQRVLDVTNRQVMTFQPNIGVGLKIKGVAIDYALTDIGDQSVALYSNVFSLKFDVVKPEN